MESLVDQHNAVLEEKKSIDKEVKKIMQLVSSKDECLNSEDISFLLMSIHDFSRNYQSLCRRYDGLIGELKSAFHHECKRNGELEVSLSSSDFSDFEADEFAEANSEFKETSEAERETFCAFIADREATITTPEDELQKARAKISKIESENVDLLRKLEIYNQQLTDVNQRMVCFARENEALIAKQLTISRSIEDAEKSNAELKLENDKLKEERADLHKQITVLQTELDNQSSLLKVKEEQQKSSSEEKLVILANLQQAVSERSAVQAVVDGLKEEISKLKHSMSDVRSQYSELEIMEEKDNETLQANVLIGKLESDLMLTQEEMVVNQKLALGNLVINQNLIKNEITQKMMEELEAKVERIHQLEIILEERKRQIQKAEENHRDALNKLKLSIAEKANADREIMKLNELAQKLELHLRLLDRKLKIAKYEYKEKDESYKKKAKEFQQKCTQLEEHCDALYEEICFREKVSEEVQGAIATKVGSLIDSFQSFELLFEETHGHFRTRISECSNELRILEKEFVLLRSMKKHLEVEKHEHMVKLVHQEESLSTMKDESISLLEKLAAKQEDEESLKIEANSYKKQAEELSRKLREEVDNRRRILDLERKLKETEEQVRAKDDEKREAIRQLCVLIEYHREKFDELVRSVSVKGRRIKSSS